MNRKTTLLLALLLALLGGLVFWQSSREAAEVHLVDERLFEGVDIARVTEIRVDNIERSLNLRFERDEQGIWYITDPMAYPAESGLVMTLLGEVERGRVMVVPESEADEEALGFAPPRIVLTVIESDPSGAGAETQHRIEIGAPDLDGQRVHIRKGGRYFRTLRTLYSTLNRGLDEFRSLRVLQLAGRRIVEVHRTGSVQTTLERPPEDLTLHAYLEGGVWRSLLPYEARLDPMDVGVLVYGIARLNIEKFIEDQALDLSLYGMDQPLVRLSLGLSDGTEESLLVSRIGNTSRWFVMHEGDPYVWSIDDPTSLRLFYPFEAMLEGHFMNVRRGEVSALLLARPGGELRIERGARAWTVRSRADGGDWSPARRGDRDVIEDWLGRLETLEVERFLLEQAPATSDSELAIHVETPSGLQGGRFAAERIDEQGEPRLTFLRDGDEVAGLVPAWTAELARSPERDFLSLDLLALDEIEQAALELRRGDELLRYTRDGHGLWHVEGREGEAFELLSLLDPLLFLKARRHLAPDEPRGIPLEDPVEVTFVAADGSRTSFVVGLGQGPDGQTRTELELGGSRSVAKRGALHGQLLGLFGT